jgi:hypothetical protein
VSRNRAYKRIDVKRVDVEALRDRTLALGGAGTVVGLDIGKDEIVACVRWSNGEFERPWSVRNPSQIDEFLELLKVVKSVGDSLTLGLESTGTYGEAMRRALTIAGFEVHRISGKATSDYQEIFDGVPSQHDGKDAAVIAELTAFGKGTAWPYEAESENLQRVKHQVARLEGKRGPSQPRRWIFFLGLAGASTSGSKTLVRRVYACGEEIVRRWQRRTPQDESGGGLDAEAGPRAAVRDDP